MIRFSDCVCNCKSRHIADKEISVETTVGRPKGSFKSACAVRPNSSGTTATMNIRLVERCFIIAYWVRQEFGVKSTWRKRSMTNGLATSHDLSLKADRRPHTLWSRSEL